MTATERSGSRIPRLTRMLLLIGSIVAATLISGCASKHPDESQLPWARPATWEGGLPGMGGAPGMGF